MQFRNVVIVHIFMYKICNKYISKLKDFPLGRCRLLLFSIFLISNVNPGQSAIYQANDSVKMQLADTSKPQPEDTVKLKTNDAAEKSLSDSALFRKTTFTSEELVRGERLFSGLVYLGDKAINCSVCHNTSVSDTLNWNPDALVIARKYLNKSALDLSRVLLKPTGKKMKLVHKDFQLSTEDIVLIKAYLNTFSTIGIKPEKPLITKLLILIISSLIFLISIVDLVIKKVYKNQRINWIVLSVTGTIITWILVVNAIAFGRSKGYAPDQPIKFSHAVHAGQNKTDCNYCHYTAKISKTAGIPPASVCLNCHFLVRNGTRSGLTEIAKVIDAYENKKAVEWIRIYRLPDFVFFSHKQHVTAGEIACETCHGNVKEMDRLSQVPDLSMGWCVKCHDTRKVNITNQYYKKYYSALYDSVKAGKIDSVMVTGTGGRDCGKCHY